MKHIVIWFQCIFLYIHWFNVWEPFSLNNWLKSSKNILNHITTDRTITFQTQNQHTQGGWEITSHLPEIMWLWSCFIWQNRKCFKEGKRGRTRGQFCANTPERHSCEWHSFREMAFRTLQSNVCLLLLISVCLHFITGTVAFKYLSGQFTDSCQILVMEVMWDTWFYVSGFVFR